MTISVTIQYFDGCPGWEAARAHLEQAATYATPDGPARAPTTAQLVAVLAARRVDQPAGTADQGLSGAESTTRK